jgi:hypothetical protein
MNSVQEFVPIRRAWARVDLELLDSEASAFYALLYLGELIVKVTAAAFVGAINDDPDRRRDAAIARLIRGSGVGEHASVLEETLSGPTYQALHPAVQPLQQEITRKAEVGTWQRSAVDSMREALRELGVEDGISARASSLSSWFHYFALLRNKTRGHGAPLTEMMTALYPIVRRSLEEVASNFGLFQMPWAYIRRNLSGRYRVVPFGGASDHSSLTRLASVSEISIPDGVYVAISGTRFNVDMFVTDADLADFYVANGGPSDTRCEFISLISGSTREIDGSKYRAPARILQGSETDGANELYVLGSMFTNVPARLDDYVPRLALEETVYTALLHDRHEIITLAGPGGAGKTSLALQACHRIALSPEKRFHNLIWFSARDIDLLTSGPKTVRPQGLTLKEFAKSYVSLVSPAEASTKGFSAESFLARELQEASVGPCLFVFDNFETVVSQAEIFEWIDSHIRAPNKVLITTRTREFTGDKPIVVQGMTDDEAKELIARTSRRYGFSDILKKANVDELVRESGGHAYVLRIFLGEIASRGVYVSPERVIADEDRLLGALFERTFARLSPVAQLLFLILSSWRSAVPTLALEATFLYHSPERLHVPSAIDELARLSLIEEIHGRDHKVTYLNVPLAALTFGRKKLITSSHRALIEKCVETLQLFGATQASGTDRVLAHALFRFLSATQKKIESDHLKLDDVRPMLEFLASSSPELWVSLERLVAHVSPERSDLRVDYLKRYLEASPDASDTVAAWRALAQLLGRVGDTEGEVLAYGEIARLPGATIADVSEAANRLNTTLKARQPDVHQLSAFAKRETILRVARRLEGEYQSLRAKDLSRLAWLYMNVGNESDALRIAMEGVRREPDNDYCGRLFERLSQQKTLTK